MSFTRFHDDPNRIKKKNIEISMMNQYTFNTPNNINNISVFFNDPHLRMQKSGNQLYKDITNVESELLGINRSLNRDHIHKNNYKNNTSFKLPLNVKSVNENITNQSLATVPAWLFRETQQYRPNILFHDPQQNTEIPFTNKLDTNILEKDYYNLNLCKKI